MGSIPCEGRCAPWCGAKPAGLQPFLASAAKEARIPGDALRAANRGPLNREIRVTSPVRARSNARRSMKLPPPNGHLVDPILSDEEIVRRVVAGEPELFELLMRRHNQRLFRTVRGIVGDAAS